ncbi:MAG: CsgG/HfaB family protein [Spirochaetia bacterium]|nr:CsgG/HfaB family protein [Spirochaetia bacterium]
MPKIFTGGAIGRLPLLIMITVLIQLSVPGVPLVADEASQQVSVAVFDLAVTGNMEKDNAVSLSNLLQAAIKENAVFDVVERDRLQDVQQEQMRQLSGGIEEAVEIGKMHAAQQLLIGSVGKLFDNIVITVRLVETETGRIIAADTIYTDKQFIETDIKKLAVRLATKSLDYTRPISMELINVEIEQENFQKGKAVHRYLYPKKRGDSRGCANCAMSCCPAWLNNMRIMPTGCVRMIVMKRPYRWFKRPWLCGLMKNMLNCRTRLLSSRKNTSSG